MRQLFISGDMSEQSVYKSNLCQVITPRRIHQYDIVVSSQRYVPSSFQPPQSLRLNSSKQTKVNQCVRAFDSLIEEKVDKSSNSNKLKDQEIFFLNLGTIQQQMIKLDSTIEELEKRLQDIKIKELNFLNCDEDIFKKIKYINAHSNELKLFNNIKEPNDNIFEMDKPDDYQKHQIVYIQQNLTGIVGQLGQILQNQPTNAIKFKQFTEETEVSFTFNKSLNRFSKIYKCKFCDLKFSKACSLGGHISRTHKEESLKWKKEALPTKKTSIQKQKKAALQKTISVLLQKQ